MEFWRPTLSDSRARIHNAKRVALQKELGRERERERERRE
jgi:hypothetical protein